MPGASTEAVPRSEHPRPDFQREHWINLNGRWRFSFDPDDVGEQMRWYRVPHPAQLALATSADPSATFNTGPGSAALAEDPFGDAIVVPFPWESRLSTICDPQCKGAAWYQRGVAVPREWAVEDVPSGPRDARGLPSMEDSATATTAVGAAVTWRLRPFLCFGAVDWNAKVWVNGRFVAEHDGGYTPFDLDLSYYVRPGRPATITVRAWDTAAADTPIGKQTVRWYTPSSGIWQTVWLEGRPDASLSRAHITPHLETGSATFSLAIEAIDGAGPRGRIIVESKDGSFPAVEQEVTIETGRTEVELEVRVAQPRAWSPEDPHLYECTVRLTATAEDGAECEDEIGTYFGLRAVSKGYWDGRPYEYVYLNGKPIYLRGALDQAFHPAGLHTYPSDEAIRADIQAAKDLGLNMLRCHIKVNEPRYYYWADKLGVLIMYDLPSASVYTPKARANWEQTFRDALERDYSHPSIFAWILFNETWGLEEHQTPASWGWVKSMYDLAKELDPTRLVEDNSATLYDHVDTDMNTWHFYIDDYDRARRHVERIVQQTYEGSPFNYVGSLYHHFEEAQSYRQGTQPLLNSEYAGLSARQGDRDISYTFKFLTSELRRHDKICGYVYTELTDIEWEHNGLLNYDRTWKEFGYDGFVPEMQVADLNCADFVGLDCPPCQTLRPGSTFGAPVFVSHWDDRPLGNAVIRWRVMAIDRFGETRTCDEGRRAVQPRHYGVSDGGRLETRLPDEHCLVTVAFWLEDGDGNVRAQNYVNVDVAGADPDATTDVERIESGYALRFRPGDFVDSSWPNPRLGARASKFGASGTGWVEYAVALPANLDSATVRRLRLRFEAGARTARNRIGWKDPLYVLGSDYPQTERIKLPTDVTVSVNGVVLGTVRLPDDPADAHGVLSAHLSEHWETCSYGYPTTLAADASTVRSVLESAQDGQLVVRFEVPRGGVVGGLNLYGARMGAYPVDPTVFLDC
ncbi:MAG: hypothetical protein HY332_15815 [Chloroflexi bacterium]|nr:hypothetical protein [Chloroflexota bacterium]